MEVASPFPRKIKGMRVVEATLKSHQGEMFLSQDQNNLIIGRRRKYDPRMEKRIKAKQMICSSSFSIGAADGGGECCRNIMYYLKVGTINFVYAVLDNFLPSASRRSSACVIVTWILRAITTKQYQNSALVRSGHTPDLNDRVAAKSNKGIMNSYKMVITGPWAPSVTGDVVNVNTITPPLLYLP
ncbi:hypothetical protein AVEN_141483-1 [Araneus ventricosus]|uniref:Uncharacterized protein n=1 Tax=Araneus ventricosus TaxID=182803 RepID=A0A4Y2UIM7_ARAVE|nr:hypothetical protein AVEN_141483-1 [Araneus ventricosus]